MERYIYINYAYEDYSLVQPIIEAIEKMGIKVYHGNGSEERVAGGLVVIHFRTPAAHTSKSYRKIMNYTLKHELDTMLFHLDGARIASEIDVQLDVLHTLFKYKYQMLLKCQETSEPVEPEGHSGEQPELVEPEVHTEEQSEPVEPETHIEEHSEPEPEVLDTREALYAEGMRIFENGTTREDAVNAVRYLRQAASQGHTQAQYQLSICYDRGIGVRKNMTEAAKWCQMAAFGGHAKAQSEIGYCYESGQGVVRNIKEAVSWYEMASAQGNIEAKNNLAFCYQKGRGVQKDVKEAIRLYTEAAAGGHASAQYNLGYCYWYGEGVPTDKNKAIELFKQSADNGNAKAAQMLKILSQHLFMK